MYSTERRSAILPMMQMTLKGLLAVIEARGLSYDDDFYELVGQGEGLLDQLAILQEESPGYVPPEEIAALYKSGLSAYDVGVHFGISVARVYGALRRLGIHSRPKGKTFRQSGMYPERTAKMIELHKAGHTLDEIGAHFKLTRERARQILTKAGVDTSQRPLKAAELAMVKEYLAGESLLTVSERHSITANMLRNLILKAGYEIRPSPRKHGVSVRNKVALAVKLYNEGMKVADIAEKIGARVRADQGHGGQIYRLLAIGGVRPNRNARHTPKPRKLKKDGNDDAAHD